MKLKALLLFLVLITFPVALNAEPPKILGMWVWSKSAYATPEARKKLIRFCIKHEITHLDVYVHMSSDPNEQPELEEEDAFRKLISVAGRNNITVSALRGDPRMFFSDRQEQTLAELRAVVDFSKTLPAENSFQGIKYDVEPYCTKEWKARGTAREVVMTDYLSFLRRARYVLHTEASRFRLAADTPFWWDRDEFSLSFDGQEKRFSEHVQDLTDFIAIMSYRRSPRDVLACVEGERRYARQIRKIVFPSLETGQLKTDPQISFWGLSQEEFWNTVPQLLEEARNDPSLGGLMLHSYRTLLMKFNRETPNPDGHNPP